MNYIDYVAHLYKPLIYGTGLHNRCSLKIKNVQYSGELIITDDSSVDDVVICDVNGDYVKPGPEDAGRLWYLGRSIQNMDKADYIVFHNHWRSAKGCWVEHAAAEMYFKWRFGDSAGQDAVSEHIREIAFGRNR